MRAHTHTVYRTLTKDPHIAGSETNIQLAYFVAKQWEDLGFDKVELFNYTVLLQYPNDTNPNKFQLLDGSGTVFYDAPTAQMEPPLTTDEKKPGVARPFNAYSGVGSARVRTLILPSSPSHPHPLTLILPLSLPNPPTLTLQPSSSHPHPSHPPCLTLTPHPSASLGIS